MQLRNASLALPLAASARQRPRLKKLAPLLIAALSALGASAHAAPPGGGIDELVRRADTNRDGVVTRLEYAQARMAPFQRLDRDRDGALSARELKLLDRARQPQADQLRATLRLADADRDGRVTAAEYRAAPTPMFDRADLDHDGRITPAEQQAIRARLAAAR